MDVVLTYRGRVVSESDIEFVRALIREHPAVSRRELSRKLCRAWNWVQANGAPCDMVCRGLMLTLERSGHVRLPQREAMPIRWPRGEGRNVRKWMRRRYQVLGPLEFRLVRRTREEPNFAKFKDYSEATPATLTSLPKPDLTKSLSPKIEPLQEAHYAKDRSLL